ncbi:hypothetical protein [Saccharothrix violaceirubra]|uniref:Guanyl-specific ribonuclease Sa n=1 Tax=Saccharothrix violaceirubra TaxID=413306 RepID=A0A7W7T180_9PSEU|nr:hypothetical protein [Saccharothrix violaceirubra]MBB4963405.1 guanyl-specific ribonuclease Sa [Saccharothrix violaceirubra]
MTDRRNLLRMSALTGLVAVAVPGTATAAPSSTKPVGVWEVTLVIKEQQRPAEVSLWSLGADGLFLHTSDNGGTGFGRWERTGRSTFTARYREYVFSTSGVVEGQLRVSEECTFTGADRVDVASTADFHTPDGVLVGTFHAAGTGVRVL